LKFWFKNGRAKCWRYQRGLILRNTSPLAMGHPVIIILDGPYNAIFILQPNWSWVPLVPLQPQIPGPPMPSLPCLPLPPPPMSSFGLALLGLAWVPVISIHFLVPIL
ncbi:hypothetical protein DBR06_SOUSAS58410001, partial [Sousa chinensis]